MWRRFRRLFGQMLRHGPGTTHSTAPQEADSIPPDVLAMIERLQASDYSRSLGPLRILVAGRAVVNSEAGNSGYAVHLDDGQWVMCFLRDGRLEWESGVGSVPENRRSLLDSADYGDGTPPLHYDYPYAAEPCDLAAEVAKSHGQTIDGIAIGENSFNLCFVDGHEIDATVVTLADGGTALRVFWEQW